MMTPTDKSSRSMPVYDAAADAQRARESAAFTAQARAGNVVYAYGGVHERTSYETAVAIAKWFVETDVNQTKVGIARITEYTYEMVGFGEDADGNRIGEDSTYISVADGKRLLKEGLVEAMVLTSTGYPTEEETAKAYAEQFED